MTILIPLLVCLGGVLTYALSANAKIQEIGRAAMWCGLLVTLMALAHGTIRLLPS